MYGFARLLAKDNDMTLRNNIECTKIPGYSKKQEMFNSISHFLGIPFALFIIAFGFYRYSTETIRLLDLFGYIVFGLSALVVYIVSSIYHITKKDSPKKKTLRIIDHCMIYLLIAGTYTPVCFALFKPDCPIFFGTFMLIFEWLGAITGIIINAFFFQNKAARAISFVLYILMGWLAVICGATFYLNLSSFLLILIGGVIYTIGSILYGCGHGWKWFHFIFHIFVLGGTIVQTIGVFLL